jgi:hypothetical protein
MSKYFSYDAIDVNLYVHDTVEEAKQSALDIAEDGYYLGPNWDGSFPDDQQDMIKNICYGVILGWVDLPCRPTSIEEDGEEAAEEFKYIVQPPVIVECEQGNGWIKCSDRLPPVNEDGESCSVLLYGMDILSDFGSHQFIGYLMEGKFYCDAGYSPHQCYHVTHWQPLPPPPTE